MRFMKRWKKPMVAVTVLVPERVRLLMEEAVRQGDFESLSETGRKAILAWAEEYEAILAKRQNVSAKQRLFRYI